MKRSVKDFEGYYSVSDQGEVFNDKTGHVKKQQIHQGYNNILLWKDGKESYKKVHRLVAEAFIPNPENKPDVNHKNCVKTDNRVQNLEWVTKKENNHHAWQNGLNTIRYGEETSGAKLDKTQVMVIRDCFKLGLSNLSIAKYFNVDPSNISHIKRGKSWAC